MFKKRFRHRVPALNTTATADISFMLLVFFLVTTSIDRDEGLARRLAPLPQDDGQKETVVKQRDVMMIALDEADVLTCNGDVVTADALEGRIKEFVDNKSDRDDMPERHKRDIALLGACAVTDRHVIAVQVDRQSTYNAYFAMQNAISSAYGSLRDSLARKRFGCKYADCSPAQQKAVVAYYPQRVTEIPQEGEGGAQ